MDGEVSAKLGWAGNFISSTGLFDIPDLSLPTFSEFSLPFCYSRLCSVWLGHFPVLSIWCGVVGLIPAALLGEGWNWGGREKWG